MDLGLDWTDLDLGWTDLDLDWTDRDLGWTDLDLDWTDWDLGWTDLDLDCILTSIHYTKNGVYTGLNSDPPCPNMHTVYPTTSKPQNPKIKRFENIIIIINYTLTWEKHLCTT